MTNMITLNVRKRGSDLVVENKLGLILAIIGGNGNEFQVKNVTDKKLERINAISQDYYFLIANVAEE